jgi:hypothetical protein
MTLFQRARYALILAIVAGSFISLLIALGSADAIGLLPPDAFNLALSPSLMVVTYIAAFLVAPRIAKHLPIARW